MSIADAQMAMPKESNVKSAGAKSANEKKSR
jgi:hypothetical protein